MLKLFVNTSCQGFLFSFLLVSVLAVQMLSMGIQAHERDGWTNERSFRILMVCPAQTEDESTFVYLSSFASKEMPGQDCSLFIKFQGFRFCFFFPKLTAVWKENVRRKGLDWNHRNSVFGLGVSSTSSVRCHFSLCCFWQKFEPCLSHQFVSRTLFTVPSFSQFPSKTKRYIKLTNVYR